MGCNEKQKMNIAIQEKIGTVVLVLAKSNPAYSKEETLKLSQVIDPMIDKFEI
jgi:hypothetical protein